MCLKRGEKDIYTSRSAVHATVFYFFFISESTALLLEVGIGSHLCLLLCDRAFFLIVGSMRGSGL